MTFPEAMERLKAADPEAAEVVHDDYAIITGVASALLGFLREKGYELPDECRCVNNARANCGVAAIPGTTEKGASHE